MNIFDQLKDIIQDKNNKLADDCEFEKEFTPYMMQRWLSFYSNSFSLILNNTSNVLWKSFEDKQIWYKFFSAVIPKNKIKNIKYIKKNKDNKKDKKLDNEIISYLAQRTELSEKEINNYIDSGIIDTKILKKQLENN